MKTITLNNGNHHILINGNPDKEDDDVTFAAVTKEKDFVNIVDRSIFGRNQVSVSVQELRDLLQAIDSL